jgi:hypothetical protein
MNRRMKFSAVAVAAGLALAVAGIATQPQAPAPAAGAPSAVRFETLDVFVDSGAVPLAAYQLEVRADTKSEDARAQVKLVGVEGGDRGAFEEPPRYDPEALLRGERIILAAYSLLDKDQLPTGKTRVARIHVQVPTAGLLGYVSVLTVAGDSMANEIQATVKTEPAELANNKPQPAVK